jgi:hypothetical protein
VDLVGDEQQVIPFVQTGRDAIGTQRIDSRGVVLDREPVRGLPGVLEDRLAQALGGETRPADVLENDLQPDVRRRRDSFEVEVSPLISVNAEAAAAGAQPARINSARAFDTYLIADLQRRFRDISDAVGSAAFLASFSVSSARTMGAATASAIAETLDAMPCRRERAMDPFIATRPKQHSLLTLSRCPSPY